MGLGGSADGVHSAETVKPPPRVRRIGEQHASAKPQPHEGVAGLLRLLHGG
jgi:hypothetical protein